MGAGFPLFLMGTLILFVGDISGMLAIGAGTAVIVGLGLFFDPR
jgi:hypothetical protein